MFFLVFFLCLYSVYTVLECFSKAYLFQRIMALGPSLHEAGKLNNIIFLESSINKNRNTNIMWKVPTFTVSPLLTKCSSWFEFVPTETSVLQFSACVPTPTHQQTSPQQKSQHPFSLYVVLFTYSKVSHFKHLIYSVWIKGFVIATNVCILKTFNKNDIKNNLQK